MLRLPIVINTKYQFNDRFNLQLEGAYSQKGFEFQEKNVPGQNIIYLNFIDFSLIGEYSFNNIIALNIEVTMELKLVIKSMVPKTHQERILTRKILD